MRNLIPAIFLLLAIFSAACTSPNLEQIPVEQNRAQRAGTGQQDSGLGAASAPAGDSVRSAENTADPILEHTVSLGETLNTIAEQYGVDGRTLMIYNNIENGNLILPGQVLRIPDSTQSNIEEPAPQQNADSEIISDHELVYGLDARNFNIDHFLQSYDGYLLTLQEEVEGQLLGGSEIVQLVADRHSINPKLLLALLEYDAGALTQAQPADSDYILGYENEGAEGLYRQLSWAANLLNWGFYSRADGSTTSFTVSDTPVDFSSEISDGTAGVQNYLGARDGITYNRWLHDVGPDGFAELYRDLFGDSAVDAGTPLLPDELYAPALLLPWESGETWHLSSGPHGGWNSGSAWAALDFVPSDIEYGCVPSESWVTAVAGGVITRSGLGAVVLDLDGDGYAGSGWAITYMHLDNNQRIAAGMVVDAGDRIGHPGCEGGFSNGTHLHLARTYNGRWISADGDIPFNLSGWISGGEGYEYNGWLVRDGVTKTADVYKTDSNAITAD